MLTWWNSFDSSSTPFAKATIEVDVKNNCSLLDMDFGILSCVSAIEFMFEKLVFPWKQKTVKKIINLLKYVVDL